MVSNGISFISYFYYPNFKIRKALMLKKTVEQIVEMMTKSRREKLLARYEPLFDS